MAASRQFLLKCSLVLQISLLAGATLSAAKAEHFPIDVPQPAQQCSESFDSEFNKKENDAQFEREILAQKISRSRLFIDFLQSAEYTEVYPVEGLTSLKYSVSYIRPLYRAFNAETVADKILNALEKIQPIQGLDTDFDSYGNVLDRIDVAAGLLDFIWKECLDDSCKERYYALAMPIIFARSFILTRQTNNLDLDKIQEKIKEMIVAEKRGQSLDPFIKDNKTFLANSSPSELIGKIQATIAQVSKTVSHVQNILTKNEALTREELYKVKVYISQIESLQEMSFFEIAIAKASRMAYLFNNPKYLEEIAQVYVPFVEKITTINRVLMENKQVLEVSQYYVKSYEKLIENLETLSKNLNKYSSLGQSSSQSVVLIRPGSAMDTQQKPVAQAGAPLTVWQKMAKLARRMVGISEWEYKAAPLAPLDLKKLYDERAIALENIGSYKFNLGRKDLTEAQLFEESMKVSYTELLLSTNANLISQSVQDRVQQLSQLNNKIMKNRGPADRLISASVVSQVQKDLLDLTQKIDQLYSKYIALGRKKEQFVRELTYEMKVLEELLRADLGIKHDSDFMAALNHLGANSGGRLLLKNRQSDIELYLEMQKNLSDARASFANFNLTIQGVSMAKQTVKLLNNYCRDIVQALTAQNVAGLAGTTGLNANTLKELAEKNRNLFEQNPSQTRVLEMRK